MALAPESTAPPPRVEVTLTSTPWAAGFDALVIALGSNNTLGGLGEALMRNAGDSGRALRESRVHQTGVR